MLIFILPAMMHKDEPIIQVHTEGSELKKKIKTYYTQGVAAYGQDNKKAIVLFNLALHFTKQLYLLSQNQQTDEAQKEKAIISFAKQYLSIATYFHKMDNKTEAVKLIDELMEPIGDNNDLFTDVLIRMSRKGELALHDKDYTKALKNYAFAADSTQFCLITLYEKDHPLGLIAEDEFVLNLLCKNTMTALTQKELDMAGFNDLMLEIQLDNDYLQIKLDTFYQEGKKNYLVGDLDCAQRMFLFYLYGYLHLHQYSFNQPDTLPENLRAISQKIAIASFNLASVELQMEGGNTLQALPLLKDALNCANRYFGRSHEVSCIMRREYEALVEAESQATNATILSQKGLFASHSDNEHTSTQPDQNCNP